MRSLAPPSGRNFQKCSKIIVFSIYYEWKWENNEYNEEIRERYERQWIQPREGWIYLGNYKYNEIFMNKTRKKHEKYD